MSGDSKIEGLCIKASPLGENGRLITVLTDEQAGAGCQAAWPDV